MLILFQKRKGVKIATSLIFEEMQKGASVHYILGMIDFAFKIGAITKDERSALIQYLEKRG